MNIPPTRQRIEHWQQRIESTPDSAPAHFNLGLAYTRAGKMTSAERAYRRAVELDPAFLEAWVNLAGTLLHQWRFKESLEAGRKAAELDPNLAQVHFDMGQAHLYLGDAEAVVRCNERALELAPDHPAATYFLAVGMLATDRVQEARKYLNRAIDLGYKPAPELLREMEKRARGAAGQENSNPRDRDPGNQGG